MNQEQHCGELCETAMIPRPGKSLRKRLKAKKRLYFYLFLLPSLIGFCGLTVYPVFRSLYMSFTNRNLLYPGAVEWVGWQNYAVLLRYDEFWKALSNSLIYALATVVLLNIIGILTAYLLSYVNKAVGLFRTIFFIPSILPTVALIVMFQFFLDPTNGMVNNLLMAMGVDRIDLPLWLSSPNSGVQLTTLIIMALWGFGSKMIIYIAGLKNISNDYYEAAAIDGASGARVFFQITLPLLTPSIFYNVTMSIIAGIQVFTESFVATGGTTKFYVHLLYTMAYQRPFMLGRASAMAWILFLVVAFFTAIYYLINRKLVYYDN